MLDRILSTVMALSLAFLVWLYARSRDQEMLDNMPIPVQITLAQGQADLFLLDVIDPSQITASFTGPPARIRELRGMLQRGEVQVNVKYVVPEERQRERRYSDTVQIQAADVQVPPGVTTVLAEGRNRIAVTLHRLVERHVPVRFEYAADERLGAVTFEPVKVLVRGPQELLDRLRSRAGTAAQSAYAIPTQPFLVTLPLENSSPAQPISLPAVSLVQEIDGRPVRVTPAEVVPRITIQPQQQTFEPEVPIRFLCPDNFPMRPQFLGGERTGKIKIRISGNTLEDPASTIAYIDLTRKKFEPGLQQNEPLQLQLPKGFHLAQDQPRPVPFKLVPIENRLEIAPGP